MLKYIGKRLLLFIPTILIISVVIFFIIQLPPGDYASSYAAAMAAEGEILTPEQIQADAAATRERGYAIEDGEHRIGLRAIAAPIPDADGRVRYAIGVVGMFRRVQSEEFLTAAHLSVEAARAIATSLQRRL